MKDSLPSKMTGAAAPDSSSSLTVAMKRSATLASGTSPLRRAGQAGLAAGAGERRQHHGPLDEAA